MRVYTMKPRLVLPPSIDLPLIRQSARVSTVARLLDEAPSQIRRMITAGDLEAHRSGKRGVRVFLDSVQALQEARISGQKAGAPAPQGPPKPLSKATQAAHRAAIGHLQDLGLMPASRR